MGFADTLWLPAEIVQVAAGVTGMTTVGSVAVVAVIAPEASKNLANLASAKALTVSALDAVWLAVVVEVRGDQFANTAVAEVSTVELDIEPLHYTCRVAAGTIRFAAGVAETMAVGSVAVVAVVCLAVGVTEMTAETMWLPDILRLPAEIVQLAAGMTAETMWLVETMRLPADYPAFVLFFFFLLAVDGVYCQ